MQIISTIDTNPDTTKTTSSTNTKTKIVVKHENYKIEFHKSRSKMKHTLKETSPVTKKWPIKKGHSF